MRRIYVYNDLHLGVQRTGGTTLASAEALREYAQGQCRRLLGWVEDGSDVLLNGDVCDSFACPLTEALDIYISCRDFLTSRPNSNLIISGGNHDFSKNSATMGAVQFIGALLKATYPDRFRLIDKPADLGGGVYVIPHLPNQDVWDLALGNVPDGTKFLFLHVNYDNVHACESDHSLNLSRDQAKVLKARGITMILGHEHQQKQSLGGSVLIVGNQFPTSVSDCLGNTSKRALVLSDGQVEFVTTWTPDDAEGWYATIDWRELKDVQEEGRGFIRVEGAALAAEASDVIKAISSFRQRSKSFVVTNAVKVEQVEGLSDIADSIEDVRGVNVVELLLEMLDPKQKLAVQALYEMEST